MSSKRSSENNLSSGTGLIFIVFLVLKLTDTIDWSWWWVFAPFWIPIGLVIILWAIVGIFKAITMDFG